MPAAALTPDEVIHPGVQMNGACTLNFVQDGIGGNGGRVFIGTAAHCVDEVGQSGSTEAYPDFGRVAYMGPGHPDGTDFAFIEVHPEIVPYISAEVKGHPGQPTCVTASTETQRGDMVRFSGHRMGFHLTGATRANRVGVLEADTVREWQAYAPIVFGDSGGPALHLSGEALGIVSSIHVSYGTSGALAGGSGPTVEGLVGYAAGKGYEVEMRTVWVSRKRCRGLGGSAGTVGPPHVPSSPANPLSPHLDRGFTVRHRVTLPLLLLLVVALTAATPPTTSQEDAPDTLYLTPTDGRPGYGNFTTFPSNETEPVDQQAATSQPTRNRIEWWWGVDALPHNVTLQARAPVEVVVYMSAFGNAAPTLDPLAGAQGLGGYRVTADLHSGQNPPFASGATIVDVEPMSDGREVHEVTIAFEIAVTTVLPGEPEQRADRPALRLVVGLDASAPDGLTPSLLVDAAETPSRVQMEGFPYDAYRQVELAEHRIAECNERVLLQQPCEDDAPTQADKPRAPLLGGGPGIGFIVALAALSGAAVLGAKRIVP